MEELSDKLETILSHEESNDSDNFNKILELERKKKKRNKR